MNGMHCMVKLAEDISDYRSVPRKYYAAANDALRTGRDLSGMFSNPYEQQAYQRAYNELASEAAARNSGLDQQLPPRELHPRYYDAVDADTAAAAAGSDRSFYRGMNEWEQNAYARALEARTREMRLTADILNNRRAVERGQGVPVGNSQSFWREYLSPGRKTDIAHAAVGVFDALDFYNFFAGRNQAMTDSGLFSNEAWKNSKANQPFNERLNSAGMRLRNGGLIPTTPTDVFATTGPKYDAGVGRRSWSSLGFGQTGPTISAAKELDYNRTHGGITPRVGTVVAGARGLDFTPNVGRMPLGSRGLAKMTVPLIRTLLRHGIVAGGSRFGNNIWNSVRSAFSGGGGSNETTD
jgi:hypothetical protein